MKGGRRTRIVPSFHLALRARIVSMVFLALLYASSISFFDLAMSSVERILTVTHPACGANLCSSAIPSLSADSWSALESRMSRCEWP